MTIDQAFKQAPRENFLPDEVKDQASLDHPLPIGFGQTNSQPSTVKQMLEWLDADIGMRILDVGSGSGWTSALLAKIVGDKGKVFAVERVPELVEFGRQNCHNLGLKNVKFYQAGKNYGLAKYAPYDRILVSASADDLPTELIEQLKVGGKLIIPVNNDILEIEKLDQDGKLETSVHSGYVFVPLI